MINTIRRPLSSRNDPSGATLAPTYTTGLRPSAIANGSSQSTYDFSGQQRDALNRLVSNT